MIGAGMGGLMAARALSDQFDEVVVLERDVLSTEAGDRSGTPQGRHAHFMLAGGLYAICDLMPGYDQDLIEAGAVTVRAGLDIRMDMPGFDPLPQRDLGWELHAVSRPVYEFLLRRRVAALGNVTIRSGCRADAFVPGGDGRSVTGVRLAAADSDAEVLNADLFVDASSNGMLTLKLLEQIGLPAPSESMIGVDLATPPPVFELPPSEATGWKILVAGAKPPLGRRNALALHIEKRSLPGHPGRPRRRAPAG